MFYNMSSIGLDNYAITKMGVIRSEITGKLMMPYCSSGYIVILLTKSLNNQQHYRVHRLVAQMFIPNPQNKPHINHIDGNKQKPYVDNLEWCTSQENMRHAKLIGNMPTTDITINTVHAVCCALQDGVPHKTISKELDVGIHVIRDIYGRITYTDLTNQYNFPERQITRARISDDTILAIKDKIAVGGKNTTIAKEFGLSTKTISRIRLGKR